LLTHMPVCTILVTADPAGKARRLSFCFSQLVYS
jgi:hypothetical protein